MDRINNWYRGKVLRGQKLGRVLGFPTANLDFNILPKSTKEGVYACLVKYKNKRYKGALYFGPRLVLGEENIVLEIYILDFKQQIYGQEICWQMGKFIRPAKNFPSMEDLKIQLQKDIETVGNFK